MGAGKAHPTRGSSLGRRFRLICQLPNPHPVLGMALQPGPDETDQLSLQATCMSVSQFFEARLALSRFVAKV